MRLILADDSVIVREGLVRLLGAAGHDVVSTLSRAEALSAEVRSLRPDAVVIDIRMPPTHTDEGLRAATALRSQHLDLGILVLSQYDAPAFAMQLLTAGERYTGYLLKDRIFESRELVEALERIVAGGTVVDPTVVARLLDRRGSAVALDRLTVRERQVLTLMAEGFSDKGIANALFVSTRTVNTHVQQVFRKLDLPDGTADNRRVHAALVYLERFGSE